MPKFIVLSRREVVARGRELAEEHGESLNLMQFNRLTGWSPHLIYDLFGSWQQLRVAVGLKPKTPMSISIIPNSRLIELAQELADKHGERLTAWLFYKETGLSSQMVRGRFGSWGALREAVGLRARAQIQQRYTDAELLDDLLNVANRFGHVPRVNSHKRYRGKFHPCTIQRRFGSWSAAWWTAQEYSMSKYGIRLVVESGYVIAEELNNGANGAKAGEQTI